MNDPLPAGSSSYALRDPRPGAPREINVHVHRPQGYHADSPIVMVVHGRRRNGRDYLDYFRSESDRHGFLVVAPEFSDAHYPHPHAYNYGGMVDADGKPLPRDRWLFPAFDAVFQDVRGRAGARRDRFHLFGHSAGSQVVHRLATFAWPDSIERIVTANAGCYTMPVRGEAFPFGLEGIAFSDDELRTFFSRPLVVQLGDQDIDASDEHLPREPGAMRQGPHRFARGQRYFETAQREAARLGVKLAWRLAIAPGVAHSGQNLAPFAVRELLAAPRMTASPSASRIS
ncbi:MAG: alpha/beta hydrolase [Burkholderiales bacterium]|nr:alpha/beta hydrolase [Burkholderiales bacterium]